MIILVKGENGTALTRHDNGINVFVFSQGPNDETAQVLRENRIILQKHNPYLELVVRCEAVAKRDLILSLVFFNPPNSHNSTCIHILAAHVCVFLGFFVFRETQRQIKPLPRECRYKQ